MNQLEENNVITNHIVAINARDASDSSATSTGSDTVVKFGGWDKDMVAKDATTGVPSLMLL